MREKAAEIAGDRRAVAARGKAAAAVANYPQAPDEALVAGGSGGDWFSPVHQGNPRAFNSW